MRLLTLEDEHYKNFFDVLYFDPAWSYKVWDKDTGSGRSAEAHYTTTSLEDMKALPIDYVASKKSVMLMWATAPLLPEALDLMKAWGFIYKTVAFTWMKITEDGSPFMGMGYYTRANAEYCLLGTHRRFPARQARDVSQIIVSKPGRHSEKPEEARKRIERLWPGLNYLEGFARRHPANWHVWGNEAPDEQEAALPIFNQLPIEEME